MTAVSAVPRQAAPVRQQWLRPAAPTSPAAPSVASLGEIALVPTVFRLAIPTELRAGWW